MPAVSAKIGSLSRWYVSPAGGVCDAGHARAAGAGRRGGRDHSQSRGALPPGALPTFDGITSHRPSTTTGKCAARRWRIFLKPWSAATRCALLQMWVCHASQQPAMLLNDIHMSVCEATGSRADCARHSLFLQVISFANTLSEYTESRPNHTAEPYLGRLPPQCRERVCCHSTTGGP